jgi:hypothetical protein
MRVDLYSLVHKAQRFTLFRLANDLGHSECSDVVAMTALGDRVLHVMDHLQDHAYNEEHYIHPLYQRIGFDLAALETDHQELAGTLDQLRTQVDGKHWDRLSSGVIALISVYLPHLEEEERIQREVLWPAYADGELAAVMQRFKMERTPAMSRADLELLLPAISVGEMARIFQGMKSTAPSAVYAGACQLASGILETTRWEQVLAAVR